MKIAIDLRSLSSGTVSGVENYCLNLTENLLKLDGQNRYTLFYNALRKAQLPDFQRMNSEIKRARLPNRILNLALKFKLVDLETMFGEFDWLVMPNLNQFHVHAKTRVALTVHDLSPVTAHGFYDVKRRLWHKFLNYQKAFQRANVLLAVSEYTKQDIIRLFNIHPQKIKVIYPGIDQASFNPQITEDDLRQIRNRYGLPGEFILFLNTIEPRKNLASVIRAFEQINHPAHLVIAGRLGWKYSKDFNLINNSKKSAKIKYIGYVDERHKPGLIKLSRALIYPSFYEGFGFQPLEAMAMGVPVIASQVTALPEIVGDSGLLVDPYNPNEIAKAIKLLLTDTDLRNRLVVKGLERVKNYSWETTAKKTLEVLQSYN